jgi:hypothetical protein
LPSTLDIEKETQFKFMLNRLLGGTYVQDLQRQWWNRRLIIELQIKLAELELLARGTLRNNLLMFIPRETLCIL